MATDEDLLFLRAAVEGGALEPSLADEVVAAVQKVEELGGSSSAREIAVNRGFLTEEQAEQAMEAGGLKRPAATRKTGRLGNFQIIEKIGVGGMGMVYRARQLTMDRDVALKILPPRLAKDRLFVERFLREARSAARLNHAHIVQGIDVGEANGLYYFAMEYVDGETLRARIKRQGRIPEAEALQIARQIALALEHARSHNIIHRDIKPDNILLAKDGAAKLSDLGLAKRTSDAGVTQTTGPLGTPLYMSPEQARGETSIDTRSDIYALGATLYHAVAGEPPFTGQNATAVIAQHLFDKPRPPRELVAELSEGLSHVVLKMLAKRPESRYQTPAELLKDIERLLSGRSPIRATPRTPVGSARAPRRRRGSPLVPILATTAILVLAAVAWLLYDATVGGSARPPGGDSRPATLPSVPAPKPPVRPSKLAQPSRDALALAELDSARQWVAGHADDAAGALKRFRAVARRYPGTPAGRAALRAAKGLEQRRAAARHAAFDKVRKRAESLAAAAKYAQAIDLLQKFAAEHPKYHAPLLRAQGLIEAQADQAERKLRDEARKLEAQGDFAGAIGRLRQIAAFGVPRMMARMKRDIDAVEARWTEARRKAQATADQEYLTLRLKLRRLLAARDNVAAKAALKSALGAEALAPVRREVEADAGDLEALDALWRAAEQGAGTMPRGTRFSVGGIRGTFEGFENGQVTVRASGVARTKPLRELSTAEVLALAARKMAASAPATQIARGLFLMFEGKPRLAEKAFAAAQKPSADTRRYQALLARYRSDGVEAEAAEALARAERLAASKRWQQLGEELRALEEHLALTRTFARHESRIRELAFQSRLHSVSVADLFHGKCRVLGDGRRVELVYEFRDGEELADWSLVGGAWALGDGRLTLRGAAAVLSAPFARDFQATVRLADLAGSAGPRGLFITEEAQALPAYTVLLPDRSGLPVVLRVAQQPAARGQMMLPPGQPVRLTFGVRSRRLSLAAEGQEVLVWDDERATAPKELRFGLGARLRGAVEVHSVHLIGTVAKAWVSKELESRRAHLRRSYELATQPWRPVFDGATLAPWQIEHGPWRVEDGAATTRSMGSVVLKDREYGDFEWRLKVQPLRAASRVRVAFRADAKGERYALVLGGLPLDRSLVHQTSAGPAGTVVLARFPDKVDWQPGRWYDLRVAAVGPELRAEANGALLCVVRDGRRVRGWLSLDVLRGGAAFKDIALRALK